ncbi:hypothetical protein ACKLNO_07365 [Neisseriaceae bacterium B1]
MKKILIATLTAAVLAACASNTSAPTQAQSLNVTADTALLQIEKRESRTIAYYTVDGQLAEAKQAGGFYRNLLGRTQEGYAVVQDFYQDSETKQTNAIIIRDEANLTNFDVAVTEGRTIWYTPAGAVKQFADVKNGSIVRYGQYLNGQLALDEETLTETKGHRISAYYDNGKPMFVATQNSPAADLTNQFYAKGGTLILDTAKTALPKEGEANYEAVQGVVKQYEALLLELEKQKI